MSRARKVEVIALALAGLFVGALITIILRHFTNPWLFPLLLGYSPLWVPFVVVLVVIAVEAHRRARKPKPGTCQACRYDLTGNTSGVCPECGKPTEADA